MLMLGAGIVLRDEMRQRGEGAVFMNGFLDWREIEKQNDWGLREQSDAMAEMWNEGSQLWDERWKSESDFTKRQADALVISPEKSVLDVGCGTGPLTVYIAPRVKKIIAFDGGHNMLARLARNCEEAHITNVECLCGNWYTMEPGKDIPVCDVAITRWSPAQGDILKFSKCAKEYCWSLSTCEPEFAEGGFQPGSHFWCRSTTDDALNTTPRPCGRKFGLNVHFNLLYDHGANPTLNYVIDEKESFASTKDELVEKVLGGEMLEHIKQTGDYRALDMIGRDITQEEDGTWRHYRKQIIAVMGWDPREICYE